MPRCSSTMLLLATIGSLKRIMADNTCSEVWATKGCKRSFIGRRIGKIQCAMMINNPVGCDLGHVDTKSNVIADRISRFTIQIRN